jgi:F5/8 type C domain.
MSSNSQDGFTLTSTTATTAAYYAFDGKYGTTLNYYRSSTVPTLPEYLTITFPKTYKIARYTISIGYYDVQYTNMNTWDLEGLVNGSWVVLHSGSNTQIASTLTFDITPTDVTSIRIKCNTRFGTNSWGIDELSFYEKTYYYKTLLSSNNKLYSPPSNMEVIKPDNALADTTYGSNYSPLYLFDDNANTGWNALNTSGVITYIFSDHVRLYCYDILPFSAFTDRSPKSWTVQGSKDNVSWVNIKTESNQTSWASGTIKRFIIFDDFDDSENGKYKYYRFNFTSNNGGNWVALAELTTYRYTYEKLSVISGQVNEAMFVNYGTDNMNIGSKKSIISLITSNYVGLGSGKSFEHTIDLSKKKVNKITL